MMQMLATLLTLTYAMNMTAGGWPHTYQNCVAGTCRAADQIKSDVDCVESLYLEGGSEYKKIGSNMKVTLYLRNRCAKYHEYFHVLDCTKSDTWVETTLAWPVQSYKVEACAR